MVADVLILGEKVELQRSLLTLCRFIPFFDGAAVGLI